MWKLQVFLALLGGRRPSRVSLFSRLKSKSPLWTVFSKQCNIDTHPHTHHLPRPSVTYSKLWKMSVMA